MRASLALALAVTLGALAMTDTPLAVAQEPKKDEKKPPFDPENPDTYTQIVTIRKMAADKKFANPVKNVPAEWTVLPSGAKVVYTKSLGVGSSVGTEITDKDGAIWVVEKANKGTGYYLNHIKRKEEPKKP